jgi:large subunit ribosomal protein L21e
MARRSRGTLSSHTRALHKKKTMTVNDYIKGFAVGDKVTIDQHAVFWGAMPHLRYKGRVGTILECRGKAYVIEIRDGGMRKKIISSPMHIRKV